LGAFSQHLVEVNFEGVELARYSLLDNNSGIARSLTLSEDVIYIAQSASGVVAFDLNQREILWRSILADVFRNGKSELLDIGRGKG
jgi:hypothetical protein